MTEPPGNDLETTRDEASGPADEAVSHRQEQPGASRVEDVIAAMHEGAEQVKRDELETALTKLESRGSLTAEQREAIEAMADALVSNLLAAPAASLREAAASDEWERIDAAIDLFDPDGEVDATQNGEEGALFVERDRNLGVKSSVDRVGDDSARQ